MGPKIKLVHLGHAAFNGVPVQQSCAARSAKTLPRRIFVRKVSILWGKGHRKAPFFCACAYRSDRL